jgi:hypothetical protein
MGAPTTTSCIYITFLVKSLVVCTALSLSPFVAGIWYTEYVFRGNLAFKYLSSANLLDEDRIVIFGGQKIPEYEDDQQKNMCLYSEFSVYDIGK